MVDALLALLIGWLLGLVGLDTLLFNVIGMNQQNYYILWFVMGLVVWFSGLFKKK